MHMPHPATRTKRSTYFQWERFGLLETMERRAKARTRVEDAPWIRGMTSENAKRLKIGHVEKEPAPDSDVKLHAARVSAPWRAVPVPAAG
eukprot:3805244-Amphidinium_carterae.1